MEIRFPKGLGGGEGKDVKLGENTFISLHFVIVLIMFAVWLIKLGDHVETQERDILKLQAQVSKLEQILSRVEGRLRGRNADPEE